MRRWTTLLTALGLAAAGHATTFCDCVLQPIRDDARAAECGRIMAALEPHEVADRRQACFDAPPVGGVTPCYCVRATTTNLAILEACQAELAGFSSDELMRMAVSCGT